MAAAGRILTCFALLVVCVLWCFCAAVVVAEEQGWSGSYKEKQGNSSYECTPSGPCVACSSSERQNDAIYGCSRTDYHQSYTCVEMLAPAAAAAKSGTLDPQQHREAMMYNVYNSCLPGGDEEGDKLSVLGFEMIMLAILAFCGPLMYHRKKKQYAAAAAAGGITRVPSNSRF